MIKKAFYSSLLCLALVGCAANYPMSESKPKEMQVTSTLGGEAVYRQILKIGKEQCFRFSFDAQYFQSSKEGEIEAFMIANDGAIKIWLSGLLG